MAAIFSFRCAQCGKVHEGSPSIGFRAPDPFLEQTEEVQVAGSLSEDICWYEDDEGMHYFVRGCIEVPIHGVSEPFLWGVWVSLSKQSFDRYVETYNSPDTSDCYFGWLCNYLPYYEKTYALKTNVRPRSGKTRPLIELEATDHPLAVDLHNGLSVSRAQEIAQQVTHR